MTNDIDPEVFAPDDAPQDEEQRKHFKMDSLAKADWASRKLSRLMAATAADLALAKAETARITEWVNGRIHQRKGDIAYFSGILTDYHRRMRAVDERNNKTINLPHGGTLSSVKAKGKLVISDEDAFVMWAEAEHPEWLKVEPKPKAKEIRKAATEKDGKLYDENGVELPFAEIEGSGEINYSWAPADAIVYDEGDVVEPSPWDDDAEHDMAERETQARINNGGL